MSSVYRGPIRPLAVGWAASQGPGQPWGKGLTQQFKYKLFKFQLQTESVSYFKHSWLENLKTYNFWKVIFLNLNALTYQMTEIVTFGKH